MLATTKNKITCYTSYTAATNSEMTDYELAYDGILRVIMKM